MSDETGTGPPDPRAAERLLDGAGDDARFRALLAAAAAPGRPAELTGEDAAVAAFRAASPAARRSRLSVLRHFLTIKVVVAVGGSLLLTGGVAYATGNLPGQGPRSEQSPARDGHSGRNDGGADPVTQYSPISPPSAEPSPPAKPEKERGEANAPGRSKEPVQSTPPTRQTQPAPPTQPVRPGHEPTPPRGPGNNNGNPPTDHPGKSQGRGTPGVPNSGNGQGKPDR